MRRLNPTTYKRRKKKPLAKKYLYRRIGFLVIVFAIFFGVYAALHSGSGTKIDTEEVKADTFQFITKKVPFNGHYKATFDDIQEIQIEAAMAMGIDPLDSADGIPQLVVDGRLLEVQDSLLYDTEVSELPYLTPEAKRLLDEIAHRYHEREKEVKQLRLSGCLRTNDFIKKLKRRNINSVTNSCHLYGTTFDISYRNMTKEEKRTLAEILLELREAGYCYVKYEYKQPCFHITVRPPSHAVYTSTRVE